MSPMPATYVTIDESQDYFDWRLDSTTWDEASNGSRGKAIVTATRAIDRLNFAGLRTSDVTRLLNQVDADGVLLGPLQLDPSSDQPSPGQPLEFPRNGDTEIPQDIKAACCELALVLLDGIDPEQEMRSLAMLSQRFSSASSSYDPDAARMAQRHGIPSLVAWNLLYPYLADPNEIRLKRVN